MKACTTYRIHLRMFYFIEEADLQINEEMFFSENSHCPGRNKSGNIFLLQFFFFRTRTGNYIRNIRPCDMFCFSSYWSFYLFCKISPCQQIFSFIPPVCTERWRISIKIFKHFLKSRGVIRTFQFSHETSFYRIIHWKITIYVKILRRKLKKRRNDNFRKKSMF